MSAVTLGTKRVSSQGFPTADGEEGVEFGVFWLRIGDVVLRTDDHHLISVYYAADGSGASKVTIELAPSSFQTVPYDQEPADAGS